MSGNCAICYLMNETISFDFRLIEEKDYFFRKTESVNHINLSQSLLYRKSIYRRVEVSERNTQAEEMLLTSYRSYVPIKMRVLTLPWSNHFLSSFVWSISIEDEIKRNCIAIFQILFLYQVSLKYSSFYIQSNTEKIFFEFI